MEIIKFRNNLACETFMSGKKMKQENIMKNFPLLNMLFPVRCWEVPNKQSGAFYLISNFPKHANIQVIIVL